MIKIRKLKITKSRPWQTYIVSLSEKGNKFEFEVSIRGESRTWFVKEVPDGSLMLFEQFFKSQKIKTEIANLIDSETAIIYGKIFSKIACSVARSRKTNLF